MSRDSARVLEKPFNGVFNGEIRMNLREWRRSKGWSQEELASKVGANPKTYSAYETGRNEISPAVLAKLRKLGFQGEVGVDALAEPSPPYVTEAQLAEWRGYWRAGMEGVLKRLDDLEDQVRKLRQHGAT